MFNTKKSASILTSCFYNVQKSLLEKKIKSFWTKISAQV